MIDVYITHRWEKFGIQHAVVPEEMLQSDGSVWFPGPFGGVLIDGGNWYSNVNKARDAIVFQLKTRVESAQTTLDAAQAALTNFLKTDVPVWTLVIDTKSQTVDPYVDPIQNAEAAEPAKV